MAINTVSAALAQYAENLLWHKSTASAESALEALRYLQINKAQMAGHAGSSLSYEQIGPIIDQIQKFLGVDAAINAGGNRPGLYKARNRRLW